MKSNLLTPEMQRRLLLLARYIQALSNGDLTTAGRILAAAEHDAVLERMLLEADTLSQDQPGQENLNPDMQEADHQLVSELLARLKASATPLQASNEPLALPRRPRERPGRWTGRLMGVLAAAVLGVLLLSSFLALLAFYHQKTYAPAIQTNYGGQKQPIPTTPASLWHNAPIPNPPLYLGNVTAISANDAWAISKGPDEDKLIHWNGQKWKLVSGAPFQAQEITFTAIAASAANNVWVVGSYMDKQGPGKGVKALIEHWDGQHWSLAIQGDLPTLGELYAVTAISTTDVWVVGIAISATNDSSTSLFLHWDGQQWHAVAHPLLQTTSANGPLEATFAAITAISPTDVWAVGSVSINYPSAQAANELKPAIEHWDGQRWQVVTSPDPGGLFDVLNSVSAVSSTDVWAVGSTTRYYNVPAENRGLIEHWNGHKWSIIRSLITSQNVTFGGVATLSATDVWVMGNTNIGGNTVMTPIPGTNGQPKQVGWLEHWDGQKWTSIPFPQAIAGFAGITPIPSSKELWVVGGYITMYGPK